MDDEENGDEQNNEDEQREIEEAEIEELQAQSLDEAEQEMMNEDSERESQEVELDSEDEYKVDTFVNLAEKLARGNYNESAEELDELTQKLRDKYLEEILKTSKIEEPKLDLDYNAYNFARTSAILSLEFSWVKLDSKIKSLIEELRDTNLTDEKITNLEIAIEKFRRKCIRKTIDFEKPKDKIENEISEPEIFEEIMKSLPDIYSAVFDVFLEPITNWISEGNSHLSAPEILKFRAYNLDLRNKKRIAILNKRNYVPEYTKCNYDYYVEYLKNKPFIKGFLFQGYWQVESMVTELRNHTEHWRKRGGKVFLNSILKRPMKDPISGTESPANFIILVSVLLLVCYHFIDVMQTWIDTDTFLKQ